MTPFKSGVEVGASFKSLKCAKSLQDLQSDTKHGILSKLTPSDPNGGQGQDDPFRYVNKVIFS